MRINQREATSGTIVIGPGEQGEIDLPWGLFQLEFNNSGNNKIDLISNENIKKITFDAPINPLGSATTLTIPLTTGRNAKLTMILYSVGDDNNLYRLLHYTVST